MNRPDNTIIEFADTQQTMTSLEIAEVTGKLHKNVLQAIRKMEPAWEKVRGLKFKQTFRISELPNGAKRQDPMYVLTKTETLYIATKFNDEARARLVLRWEQLEKERLQALQPVQQSETLQPAATVPAARNSRRQLLVMLIEAEDNYNQAQTTLQRTWEFTRALMQDVDELRARVQQLERQQKMLPATAHHDAVTYNATQLASEYGMKAVSFNNLLQRLGILYASQGQWLLVSDYAGRGFTACKHITVTDNGQKRHKPFTVWTEAGRQFIHDALAQKGIMLADGKRQKGGRV